VIFSLPAQFGVYSHPLAYVEWYTKFNAPNQASKLHTIRPSTLNHAPRASVIPVALLFAPCHLVPKVRNAQIDRSWTTDNVLDKADAFFLNTYVTLRFWSYFCLPPMSHPLPDVAGAN
jgi:hypothetical protein